MALSVLGAQGSNADGKAVKTQTLDMFSEVQCDTIMTNLKEKFTPHPKKNTFQQNTKRYFRHNSYAAVL